jgi:predicted RNase H-like HicB family nuclease
MTMLYPIVLEAEDNGTTSAYVPGLPVYAAADSAAKAERAIRVVLTAYLAAHPDSRPGARVRVARFSDKGTGKVDIVGVAALAAQRRRAPHGRTVNSGGDRGRPRPRPRDSGRRFAETLTVGASTYAGTTTYSANDVDAGTGRLSSRGPPRATGSLRT